MFKKIIGNVRFFLKPKEFCKKIGLKSRANIVDLVTFPEEARKYIYVSSDIKQKYKRIAIFASFSFDGTIPDYVIYYLSELKKVCDGIVFFADNPVILSEIEKIKHLVIYAQFERHNEYDFGSYKRGYMWLKQKGMLEQCEELLVCNDSCYGPVYPLSNVFDQMDVRCCDFWGMIQNDDVNYHLQSWFYVFRKSVLKSGLLGDFLKQVKHQDDFWDYVFKYEFQLTKFLIDKGFCADAYMGLGLKRFESAYQKSGNRNITVFPLTLIKDYKLPFIKVKCFSCGFKHYLEEQPLNVLGFLKRINPELNNCIIRDLARRDVLNGICERDIDLQIQRHDIISFDIFDTLLIRPYVKPTDLFWHLEKIYNIPGFAEARIAAELYAREKTSKKDVTLDEIYEVLLPKYQKAKAKELKMEEKSLRINPLIFKTYQKAVRQKKTILIVSDMYLPSSFLIKVLKRNGVNVFDRIYVSCEYNKTKADGSLFEQVLTDFSVNPRNILHIGDNEHSDVYMPRRYDIDSFCVSKYIDLFFAWYGNAKYKNFYEQKSDFMRSYLVSLMAQNQLNTEMSYWQQVGYNLAGPLGLGYVQLILKEVKLNDIDTLLFVSRDGYLLQKVYNKICEKPVANTYIYAPRILNLKLFGDYANQPEYLRAYMDMLKGVCLKNENVDCKKMDDFIHMYNDEIVDWHKKNKKDYISYIKSLNISGKNIASVDMTTGAYTSQKILQRIFDDRYKMSFYSACFRKTQEFKHVSYLKKEILPDVQECIINIMELLITAPEPPVVDIKNKKPVYKDFNAYDEERIRILKDVEVGVMRFIEDFCSACGMSVYETPFEISIDDVLHLFECFCSTLSNADRTYFKRVYHSADIENKKFVSLLDQIDACFGAGSMVSDNDKQDYKKTKCKNKLKLFLFFPYYLIAVFLLRIKINKIIHEKK